MDECDICTEGFDEVARRPKVLPCGHTCCLDCLRRAANAGRKSCPTDRKPYLCDPSNLPDNFYILSKQATSSHKLFWCVNCEEVAQKVCEKNHLLRGLKAVRSEKAQKNLSIVNREKIEVQAVLNRLETTRKSLTASLERFTQIRTEHGDKQAALVKAVKKGYDEEATSWKKVENNLANMAAACLARPDRYLEEQRLLSLSSGAMKVEVTGFPYSWSGTAQLSSGDGELPSLIRYLLLVMHDKEILNRKMSLPAMDQSPEYSSRLERNVKEPLSHETSPMAGEPEEEEEEEHVSRCCTAQPNRRPYSLPHELKAPDELARKVSELLELARQPLSFETTASVSHKRRLPSEEPTLHQCKRTTTRRQEQLRQSSQRLSDALRLGDSQSRTNRAPVVGVCGCAHQEERVDNCVIEDDQTLVLGDISNSGPMERRLDKEIALYSTRKIRKITGLDCSLDPQWCVKLLKAFPSQIEDLQLSGAGAEHLSVLPEMNRLRRLEVHSCSKDLKDSDPNASLWDCVRYGSVEVARLDMPPHRSLDLIIAHAATLRQLTLRVGYGPVRGTATALWPWDWNRLEQRLAECRLSQLALLTLERTPNRRASTGSSLCPGVCIRQTAALTVALPGVSVRCSVCE